MNALFFLFIFPTLSFCMQGIQQQMPVIQVPTTPASKNEISSKPTLTKSGSGIAAELGAVDPLRVLEGSLEYRKGLEYIEKELEARKKELQELEKDITKKRAEFEAAAGSAAISEAGRNKRIEEITEIQLKYQSKLQTAQQYAQGAEEELRAKVLRKVQEVVRDLGKELNLKLVLAGGVLYADESIDLTNEVVTRLNKKYEEEQKRKRPVTA